MDEQQVKFFEWVNVKDFLPHYNEKVLAYVYDEDFVEASRFCFAEYTNIGSCLGWIDSEDYVAIETYGDKVTHWMRLDIPEEIPIAPF